MSSLIINYFDQIALIGSIIVAAIFIYPKFKAKLADGFQTSDIPEAITEGISEYKSAIASIEQVAKDVTVNDVDSVAAIINIIEKQKVFK